MASQQKPTATTIVLAGSWNPAILQPAWVAQNIVGVDPAGVQVELEFSTQPGMPPRYRLNELRFAPNYDKLVLYSDSNEAERLDRCTRAASRILELLPHTPVRGVGINFEFFDDEPTAALLGKFGDPDNLAETVEADAFEIVKTTLVRALKFEGYVLNFTRELVAGPKVVYKFNFHHSVTDAAAARAVIEAGLAEKLEFATRFVAAYDGLDQARR